MINEAHMQQPDGELHLTTFEHSGHILSTDCWCEPSVIFIAKVKGIPVPVLVVQHEDYTTETHEHIMQLRERERDEPVYNFRYGYDPAITRALTPPWSEPKDTF